MTPIILDTIITSCYVVAPITVSISDTDPRSNLCFLIDSTFENKRLRRSDIYKSAFGLIVNNITFKGIELKGGFYKFQNIIQRREGLLISTKHFNATYIQGRFIRLLVSTSDIRSITDVNADVYFSKWLDKLGNNAAYYLVYYPFEEVKYPHECNKFINPSKAGNNLNTGSPVTRAFSQKVKIPFYD